jgi:hypothetical protein
MFEWFFSPEAWLVLATLTAIEIVLGIDDIIFISILVGRLLKKQTATIALHKKCRRIRFYPLLLKRVLIEYEFIPIKLEWWHFKLQNEPF